MTNQKSKIIILYHKDCADGFGAAWAAYKKFGTRAEYIGVEYRTTPPKLKNKQIYLVDFCYDEPEMNQLIKNNQNITVIDHHQSREKMMGKIIMNYSFDLKRSGAVLTWQYFHPKKRMPRLLLHIEDVDLWKFKLPFTKEIVATLGMHNFDFRVWDRLAKNIENAKKRQKIIETGRILLKYQDKLIEDIAKKAYRVNFGKHEALAINSSTSILHSQLGNFLVQRGYPVAIVWYRTKDRIKVSLRSDGKVDVAKLAEKYGGGGHKAASGFSLSAEKPLPWKTI